MADSWLNRANMNKTAVASHHTFRRPDVDFQIWVSDGEQPLPLKMVVTDTALPSPLSVTTRISNFNPAPAVAEDQFVFATPEGVRLITFMRLD